MESLSLRWLAVGFVFLLGAVCGNCWGSIARASTLGDDVLLARLCVNEAGLRAYAGDDCSAIHAVIQFRRGLPAYRGASFAEALHRYSNGVTIRREGRPRPWIAELDGHERPPSWTPLARWDGRGSLWWGRTLSHARAILAGRIEARCAPHSWARSDVRPADPDAHPVDCGSTLNVFWRVPSYGRRFDDAS